MTILHLLTRHEAALLLSGAYRPASLDSEGFVHCSADDATTLAVATAFYAHLADDLVAAVVDPGRLTSTLVREPAEPGPPPGVEATVRFPHVYGPIDPEAVIGFRRLSWRDGVATGLGPAGPLG